jgi:hypothetical protein
MPLLALGAALVKGAVGKAVGRAVGSVGKAVGRVVSGAAKRPVLTSTVTGIVGGALGGRGGGGGPPGMPPGFTPSFGPQYPVPREGPVGRTISRVLPGGLTGREFMPVEGAERDKTGRPMAVYADFRQQYFGPPGYVLVEATRLGLPEGPPVAVLKGVARALGVWKARPKPPVSGWDMRAITRAKAAQGRVKKLAGAVGLHTSRKK